MSRQTVRMLVERDGTTLEIAVSFDVYLMDRGDGVVRTYYDLEPRPSVELTDDELDEARALARAAKGAP